jgi:hypothetical protein
MNTAAQVPCVSGFVTDLNGNPVVDADLDFDDAVTGQRIYTPGDNTDSSGFYTVCLFPGIYNISYAPPPHSNLQGRQFFNVDLSDGSSLELNVTLDFGKIISGTVKDRFNNPIGDVDLDADNLSTGQRIYTPNDNSDSLTGEFWIVVPSGFYRLRCQPLRGSRWIGLEIDSLDARNDTIFDVALEEGFLFTGIVTDEMDQGLDSVTIDLRDQNTGERLYIPNDKTDSTGYYTVAVDSGLFELRYEPPRGSRHVGASIDSFAISGDIDRNQVLYSGYIFTAVVTDSLGSPVQNADIDFILTRTDEKIFTPYDKTDSLGTASFAVLPDTYNIRVQPPPGTLLDRALIDSVVISGDTAFTFELGEIDRVSLQGYVKDSAGNGLPGVEFNLIEQITGNMLLSADNYTDSLGFYDIHVPLGTYDAVLIPSRGDKIVALKIEDVTFAADTVWDDVFLDSGFVFSTTVYDAFDGFPVENIRFDFSFPDSGGAIFAPHNITDSYGTAEIVLLPDSYSVAVIMPPESDFIPPEQFSLLLSADTSMVFILRSQSGPLPQRFLLRQNFPNPFNQFTRLSYFLFEDSRIELFIYNGLGQMVNSFNQGIVNTGEHSIIWDGTDRYGYEVSSGVYFYRIESAFGSKNKKMLLIK